MHTNISRHNNLVTINVYVYETNDESLGLLYRVVVYTTLVLYTSRRHVQTNMVRQFKYFVISIVIFHVYTSICVFPLSTQLTIAILW